MAANSLDRAALERFVLLRINGAGASGLLRSALARDVRPLLASKVRADDLRDIINEIVIAVLQGDKASMSSRGRLKISPKGAQVVGSDIGPRAQSAGWAYTRDIVLVGEALGFSPPQAQRSAKLLQSTEGMRTLVLSQAYGLGLPASARAAAVRDAIAKHVLVEKFGAHLRPEMRNVGRLPADLGRAIAGELAIHPRVHKSDHSLLAQLASEALGVTRHEINALRIALLGRLLCPYLPKDDKTVEQAQTIPASRESRIRSEARHAPDLFGFVQTVSALARDKAQGWAGDRKAYISHVWKALLTNHPDWELDQSGFKGRLMQAHRAGLLSLANADLRSKANINDIEDSAIHYKNTEWHYIRVVD